jgi:hypothetical protein
VTLLSSHPCVKQYVFISIGIPYTFSFFPLRTPNFYYIDRVSPFIINVLGILPFIRAFISEQTVSRKGRIDENGAIGAIFRVDLNVFLLGNITSISVERLMISGETIGLGRELMIVTCNYFIISLLFLMPGKPNNSFFYSTCLIDE